MRPRLSSSIRGFSDCGSSSRSFCSICKSRRNGRTAAVGMWALLVCPPGDARVPHGLLAHQLKKGQVGILDKALGLRKIPGGTKPSASEPPGDPCVPLATCGRISQARAGEKAQPPQGTHTVPPGCSRICPLPSLVHTPPAHPQAPRLPQTADAGVEATPSSGKGFRPQLTGPLGPTHTHPHGTPSALLCTRSHLQLYVYLLL